MAEYSALIQSFKDFGISERETKTYLALLEHGESKVNELHRVTGLQRTKMYSIMARMVVRGLCHERVEGRNRYYSAVNPKTVLATLRSQWRTELKQREDLAADVLTDLEAKFGDRHGPNYLDSIEVIRNKAQVHSTYLALMDSTENEVCVFNRPPFAATKPALFEEQMAAQRRAYERGIYNRSILIKGVVPFDEAEFPELGDRDEIRFLDSLPIKMFVFDKARVMVAIPSAPGDVQDFSMILVDDPGFAEIAQIAFEYHWERAIPLKTMIELHRNGNIENT